MATAPAPSLSFRTRSVAHAAHSPVYMTPHLRAKVGGLVPARADGVGAVSRGGRCVTGLRGGGA